ncbi:hypothetical protein N7490_001964 [Penicillium lividum]|nr:hypothetical protein N7490_001964 [Penicillium lividum]
MPFDYFRNSFSSPSQPFPSDYRPGAVQPDSPPLIFLPPTPSASRPCPFPPPSYDSPTRRNHVTGFSPAPALPSQLTPPYPHFPPPSYITPSNVHSTLVAPGFSQRILPPNPPPKVTGVRAGPCRQSVSSRPRLLAPRPTLDTTTRPCLPTVSAAGGRVVPNSITVAIDPLVRNGVSSAPQSQSMPRASTDGFLGPDSYSHRSIPHLPSSLQSAAPTKRSGPSQTLPQPKRRMLDTDTDSTYIIDRALKLLRDDLESRCSASTTFPPVLTEAQIRASIAQYQNHIEDSSKQGVCSSCGRFVPISEIVEMEDSDPLLLPLATHLDYCGKHGDEWDICLTCLKSLSQNSVPRLSALNRVNVTMCQNYPSALEGLTPVEECLIARCHPLGIILKLRPGGHTSPVSYRALRGHFIVIPQDPEPLLEILPSPAVMLHDVIRVFWLGKQPATYADLSPFLLVRRQRVLTALQYLTRHNHVYHDVAINRQMIDTWDDDFIPADLEENIIPVDLSDGLEREGYAVHLDAGNHENDFQAAQDAGRETGINAPLMTGSVCTDINGERQSPDKRLLKALLDMVSNPLASSIQNTAIRGQQQIPSLSYRIRGQATLADHWHDPAYFTGAFPTLYPLGIGGHLDERSFDVSLSSFAEWALKHHSRRFARHRTFMYLIYDVLLIRKSSLANKLVLQRRHWSKTTDDISSLTEDRLRSALQDLEIHHEIKDPGISRLLHVMKAIAMWVPGSFAQKLRMRSEIRGLVVRFGMPAFWITINPSDLRSPLVIILAGVEYSDDILSASNSAIRGATATSNPVAVASFFHSVCTAVLDGLFASGRDRTGILGDVSNHYGVVETNGRGMLHLHAMVWLKGNLSFANLRSRVLADAGFATRVLHYLESVIIQSVDESTLVDPEVNLAPISPSASDPESDHDFHIRLADDSNLVARSKQLHSKRHFATCFKNRPADRSKSTCRFGMPREIVPSSKIDDLGVIHLARNHPWINPWNPAIASCLRSNHDISWIPTVSKSLALVYYITNYATKDDVSPWQLIAKGALLKQAIEKAKAADPPTANDLRLRERNMDNFALRCFNSLAHDREVSGVQVASTLLHLPNYYTVDTKFVRVNLWWLRQYVRDLRRGSSANVDTSAGTADEPCTFQAGETAPVSMFDNYKWRGVDLATFSFFEYCMLVQIGRQRRNHHDHFDFDPRHPRCGACVQHVARSPSQVATVAFSGQLTQYQMAEDSIRGGHPMTDAIANDLAEILLGLFVPWDKLRERFLCGSPESNVLSHIWSSVKPTLVPYIQEFATNIELLRKSKDDCQIDARLRHSLNDRAELYDRHVDNIDLAGHEQIDAPDCDDFTAPEDERLTAETLIAAYNTVTKTWGQDCFIAAKRAPVLATFCRAHNLTQINPLPSSTHSLRPDHALDLEIVAPTVLQDWENQLSSHKKPFQDGDLSNPTPHLPDFDLVDEDSMLQPILINASMPGDSPVRLDLENPTSDSLLKLIVKDIPLNTKQLLVVRKLLTEIMSWTEHPRDSSRLGQLLLCITGEGGTGKTRIPKAIEAALCILGRKHEIILTAPTGAAADNLGGNTYHTSLGINLSYKAAVSTRVRRLWARKTILVIDEMSMVDLKMLSVINNQCKVARSLPRSSPDLFGGLPIVILMGDFFQFPPVRGPPLWKKPRSGVDDDAAGRLIWHRFENVIILDEQMRQSEDPSFRGFLTRTRQAALTDDDVARLNSKSIPSLTDPISEDATVIVKLNAIRHPINRIRIENFARRRSQRIYIFPAIHTRTKSTGPVNLRLQAHDLLLQPDHSAQIPFPGLLLYTRDMPTVMLTNACTPLGQVNGATGTAVGVVLDPAGKSIRYSRS